eukprot:COSAG06_NODE_32914_length_498_cov_0.809524_2_plen_44_part_01
MIRLRQGRRLERIPLFLRRVIPFVVSGGDGGGGSGRMTPFAGTR